jgi:hypothetical protein
MKMKMFNLKRHTTNLKVSDYGNQTSFKKTFNKYLMVSILF